MTQTRFNYTVNGREFSLHYPEINWGGAVCIKERETKDGDLWHYFQLADGRTVYVRQDCYDDEYGVYRCKLIEIPVQPCS